MNRPPVHTDHTLLLALCAIFLFNSPFSRWWLGLQPPWYSIFIVWAGVLMLVAYNQWRIRRRQG
ncbi:MAG: hypothetical protein KTR33_15915 [Gammaproteobacteria bacterium]|nr:hypothetical protein [Gammaproteobacteria bacterium]